MERNPSQTQLAWKVLLLVDSGSRGNTLRAAARWLRDRLSGPLPPHNDDSLPGELLMAAAYRQAGSGPLLRLCVRQLSSTECTEASLQQACSGTCALILLTDAIVGGSISPSAAAQVDEVLPFAPVPLLVLSLCNDDGEASVTAGAAEATGTREGRHVSAVRVLQLPWSAAPDAAEASEAVLQGGLIWLAEQSPLQPQLQVERLSDIMVRRFSEALSDIPAGNVPALKQLLEIYNGILADTSSAVTAAGEMRAARWRWPPTEVAGPRRLPLLTSPADGPRQCSAPAPLQRRAVGRASTTQPAHSLTAEPWALPAEWHMPHVTAATIAALQYVAVPTPLNGVTDPAAYFASLAMTNPAGSSMSSAAIPLRNGHMPLEGRPAAEGRAWQHQACAALLARLSDLSLLRLPAVVLTEQLSLTGELNGSHESLFRQLHWIDGGRGTREAPLSGAALPTGSKRKAERTPASSPPAPRSAPPGVPKGPSSAAASRPSPASAAVAALERHLARECVQSARSQARLLRIVTGGMGPPLPRT